MATQLTVRPEDAALSLTMATVEASRGPLLLLDGDLVVVSASSSFLTAFDVDPATVRGSKVSSLGEGEWSIPELQVLLNAAVAGAGDSAGHEITLRRTGRAARELVIHAERLVYLDLEHPRLLVAVTDVTDARADRTAFEEASRRSAVLLQEIRHRVANSLHLIAIVLLQSARKSPSEETKSKLRDAHNRVMSVAALEHQLSESGDGKVDLKAYFTRLCENIHASIVADPDLINLNVAGPGGVVDARVSVNLGLIVTELVINAIKHAFPDGRHGRITVDCAFPGPNWSLSVIDNGVGAPTDGRDLRVGVGTTIVEALAKELGATVVKDSALPGTRVTIARQLITLVQAPEQPHPARTASDRASTASGAA